MNMSMQVKENAALGKTSKKSKRSKKKEMSEMEEITDRTTVEDVELEQDLNSRLENKKKKKKRNTMVSGDVSVNGESYGNFDIGNQPENVMKEEKEIERGKKNGKRITEEEDNNDKGKKKNSTCVEDVENSLVDCGTVVEKVKTKKRKNEEITDKDGHINKAQDTESANGTKRKTEKTKSVENNPKNPISKEKQKKVRFSNHTEVFPSSDIISSGDEENQNEPLIQGKRFSREEDEIVRAAVRKYIESHGLGDKGVEIVMNCKSQRKVRNCWKEIGAALPYRPYTSVYYRAHILFEGGERLEWTEEELKMLQEQQEIHGNNWKLLAEGFKRHRIHVKDTWRRIKIKRARGHWSQEEYQNLFDLVNVDLRVKANQVKQSKHGMLRDNICWTAISDRLSTRSDSTCCEKWYNQLTSSMVAEGMWNDSDDYRLLDALFNLDACCIEDVDWDYLVDQRPGDVCRRRWDQMVLHIGSHGNKSFAEQVEVLAKRYCPELLEAREAWESKPLVP